MAASSWTTWRDRTPGFKIKKGGDAAIARTFELAIAAKEAQEETSAGSLGYEKGVPGKRSTPSMNSRFAGDALIGGLNGEFGAATNDQERPNVQDSLKKWAMQWSSGPYALGAPAPPPDGAPPPEGKSNEKKPEATA